MNGKVIFISAAACAGLIFTAGCSKKEGAAAPEATTTEAPAEPPDAAAAAAAPEPAAPAPGGLPGASGVNQALASKDWQGAVGQLAAMRSSVSRDRWEEYVSLQYQVRNALGEASESDPKAAEALLTLNAMNRGR
jgi:hypothetical protein